jgi:hypothetical protein
MNRSLGTLLVAAGVALSLTACSEANKTASVSPTSSGAAALVPSGSGPNARTADVEWIELCKDYVGTPGPAVTFTVAVDHLSNGTIDQTFQTTLAGGTCKDIWFTDQDGLDTLTITETVPANYTASSVMTFNNHGAITVNAPVSGNVATALARNSQDAGSLVVFTNTFVAPPPPPTGTGGCTPGYWKQSQHFDSWTAPYTPNTLFSSVFENAFPGMTLLEVLSNGGGGLEALGRHTVAALLNAASSGVSYGMTPAQVIAAFNAAYPGSNYETQKNIFATANERGCPLN